MFEIIDSAVSQNTTGDGFTRNQTTHHGLHPTLPLGEGGGASSSVVGGGGQSEGDGEGGRGGGGGESGDPPASLRASCSVDLSELADQVGGWKDYTSLSGR